MVEHDEETIREADWVVDIGHGAGKHGGELVGRRHASSGAKIQEPDGQYLAGKEFIEAPKNAGRQRQKISILGASEFNLKDINVDILG